MSQKIIICGTSQVGFSIAEHLAGDNDITVVDSNAERMQRITEANDVRGVIGVPSHPDVLERGGAKDADMLIAVTENDEINMIACQMAHTIFNIPMKIARLRSRAYLNPEIGDLYSPTHLPIDHIISPEAEVADAVTRRLRIPGAFDVAHMCDGKAVIVGVRCLENCPILNAPLRELTNIFEGLDITIVGILRDKDLIIPRDGTSTMVEDDRVYFVCEPGQLRRAMSSFGHEEPESHRVVIAGAGIIGRKVASDVVEHFENPHCTVIEENKEIAQIAAEAVPGVTIINGDTLEPRILDEAGIANADTFVALTNDDEVNVLSSLLGRSYGTRHTVSLVNMASFVPLISTLGVDSVISPPTITTSRILRHVRRGSVTDIHTISEEKGEFIEVEAMQSSPLVGEPLRAAKLPKEIAVAAIVRGDEFIAPRGSTVIEEGDKVVLFTTSVAIREAEDLLTVRPDFF